MRSVEWKGLTQHHLLLLTTPRHQQALAERDVAFEDIMEHPERELAALAQTLGLEDKVCPCIALALSAGSRHRSTQRNCQTGGPSDSSKQGLQRMSTLATDPALGQLHFHAPAALFLR